MTSGQNKRKRGHHSISVHEGPNTVVEFEDEAGNVYQIPVVNIKDKIAPVYKYFNLKIGDKRIIEKASEYLEELASSGDLEKMRSYLWIDPILNVGMSFAVFYAGLDNLYLSEAKIGEKETDIVELPTSYGRWIAAQGHLILEILKRTKEEDADIQHWLIYEDFILELSRTQTGCKIISEIYDLRGLDFFLFLYMGSMGGETSAIKDSLLFELTEEAVPLALRRMARFEEADQVEKDIEDRKKGLIEISHQFGPIEQGQNEIDFALDRLRVEGERFWNSYLSPDVWKALHTDSQTDLIDAFVSEYLLKRGVMKSWSNLFLNLCKVIEREMSISLFEPWIDIIRESSFLESKHPNISKMKKTFDILKKCSAEPVQPPTLGQFVFILEFWNDPSMDERTDLFKKIRTTLEKYHPDSNKSIENLARALEEEYSSGGKSANIVKLRNASAHPGREGYFTWSEYLTWLKAAIGQPPKYILRTLIFDLRIPLEKNGN
jgi:hypothetical protein